MTGWLNPVRAATTGTHIALSGLQTIDGVALAAGDRVLVKDQTSASQNGIYVAAAGAWARSTDANASSGILTQSVVRVGGEGNVNGNGGSGVNAAGTEWILATPGQITPGTTSLYYVQADLLQMDLYGQFLDFRSNTMSDGDIFALSNGLQEGQSNDPNAYLGASLAGYGGICTGVRGRNGNGAPSTPQWGCGVYGDSDNGYGVWGGGAIGVAGTGHVGGSFTADSNPDNNGNALQVNDSNDEDALISTSGSPNHAAVSGWNNGGGYAFWGASDEPGGTGIYARGNVYAAQFDGDIKHTGNYHCTQTMTVDQDVVLSNADCAEDFDLASSFTVEPGMVMAIDEYGSLRPSDQSYDKKVAGVISGAGEYRAGMILDRREPRDDRVPLALMGKVCCKADAQYGAIEVGDLLTTSLTPGHAMKASDSVRAFGAVIGKALRPLESGRGLVPILISLQ
jgi:hypothetical protein